MRNIDQLINKVKQYQKADKEGTLFAPGNESKKAREILETYDKYTKQGYKMTPQDLDIRQTATLLDISALHKETYRNIKQHPPDSEHLDDLTYELGGES